MADLGRYLTVRRRQKTQQFDDQHHGEDHLERRRLAFIESPVNDEIYQVLDDDGMPSLEKMRTRASRMSTISSTGGPILYKTHHEASTIELFYDVFFVANLATFTTMHEHSDAESVQTYIGFFTLLWFTWLNTALYHVRFGTDSIVERMFKVAHFFIMAAFVFCGPIFDNSRSSSDRRAYQMFAVVQIISHALHVAQYTIVLVQSIRYKNSRLPLGLTILVNVLSAVGFILTIFLFDGDEIRGIHLVAWYAIKVASGVLTILISVFFRVISFKHTHITERVSLLTLIVIGEGVLGLSKSASCIFKSQASNNSAEIGTLIASVLLLYLLWMLYFDQLDEEATMGTIRQQFWALLHYPLHVGILLTVEGSTALVVWNSAVQGLNLVASLRPTPADAPSSSFASATDFNTYLNESMARITAQFKEYTLSDEYDWGVNLTMITDLASNLTFNSPAFDEEVAEIVDEMFDFANTFVFKAHSSTMGKMLDSTTTATDAHASAEAMYENYDVVTIYFYAAAGAVPLLLATMYWFGKPHRTKSELGGPVVRIVIGFALVTLGCVAVLSDRSTSGYKFRASHWLIPAVAIAFVLIIMLDTVFGLIDDAQSPAKSRSGRMRVVHGSGHRDRHSHSQSHGHGHRNRRRKHSSASGEGEGSTASTPRQFDENLHGHDEMRILSRDGASYSFAPDQDPASQPLRDPSPMPSPSLHAIKGAGPVELGANTGSMGGGGFGASQLNPHTQSHTHTERARRFKSLRSPAYMSIGADEDDAEGDSDDEHKRRSRYSAYESGGGAAGGTRGRDFV